MNSIGDMINRIRVALQARKDVVEIPASRIKGEIARVLKEEGYISNYKVFENQKSGNLKILLRYSNDGEPAISHIECVSKSSARRYSGYRDLKGNPAYGVTILSTPKGVISDQRSKTQRLGGELLVRVW